MKTNLLKYTLAAIITAGFTLPAMAAKDAGSTTAAGADKPEVKILFHHTSESPYDIRLLSWCGGMASRVQIVPTTNKTIIVAYNAGDLHGAKITGRDTSRLGFRLCKAGKTTTLFDLLSLEKTDLSSLATKLSNKNEWRTAVTLQSHGQLNTKLFAHTSLSRDQYAYSSRPIPSAF